MDEITVSALIAEGEAEGRVDFKKELHLDSAEGKAEFVKDVISLANSAPSGSFLLIGVDDDKYVVGVGNLEEERIQQIAQTYITPLVSLQCSLVPMATVDFLSVGVIEIKAKGRPHKVARAISRLEKDAVFVRHGSVVAKASPEEIIEMHAGETPLHREARQLIHTADTHLELGRLDSAIAAYSKAIELLPTSEAFLARGRAYELQLRRNPRNRATVKNKAHDDFSSAAKLASSVDIEKEARLGRMRIFAYSWDEKRRDIEWLKDHMDDYEYGKLLYEEVYSWDVIDEDVSAGRDAESFLSQAIDMGYREPEVYYLRAEANIGLRNYGLALEYIDEAIDSVEAESEKLVKFLCLKAAILAKMDKFKKAYRTLVRARELNEDEVEGHLYIIRYGFENSILCQCALEFEFGKRHFSSPISTIVEVLALSKGRRVREIRKRSDGTIVFKTDLDDLEDKLPGVVGMVRGIIGEKLWASMRNIADRMEFRVEFPSIREQIPDDL